MIRCVLVASVALHVAAIAALPDAFEITARPAPRPSLIEIANPPTPAPPPVTTAKEVAGPVAPTPATHVRSGKAAAAPAVVSTLGDGPSIAAPTVDPPRDARDFGNGPADFTSTVIGAVAAKAPVAVAAPPPVRMVPASSLSRKPGAPGLDAELERNYPIDARRAGISGTARLRVQILADGRTGRVERISESHPGFADACARTVRAARWEAPLDAEGRAVATEITYVCKFEVRS